MCIFSSELARQGGFYSHPVKHFSIKHLALNRFAFTMYPTEKKSLNPDDLNLNSTSIINYCVTLSKLSNYFNLHVFKY